MKKINLFVIPNENFEYYNKIKNNRGLYPHLYFDPLGKSNKIIFFYKGDNSYIKKKGKI